MWGPPPWAEAAARLQNPLVSLGVMNRPSVQEAQSILDWLAEHSGAEVRELAERFPANRREAVTRGLLWLARFGLITLRPAD